MNLKALKNTEELQSFLEGSQAVAFSLPGKKEERYAFIQSTLKQFHYRAITKRQKRGCDSVFTASNRLFSAATNTTD